jgi:hypothetical protein
MARTDKRSVLAAFFVLGCSFHPVFSYQFWLQIVGRAWAML